MPITIAAISSTRVAMENHLAALSYQCVVHTFAIVNSLWYFSHFSLVTLTALSIWKVTCCSFWIRICFNSLFSTHARAVAHSLDRELVSLFINPVSLSRYTVIVESIHTVSAGRYLVMVVSRYTVVVL